MPECGHRQKLDYAAHCPGPPAQESGDGRINDHCKSNLSCIERGEASKVVSCCLQKAHLHWQKHPGLGVVIMCWDCANTTYLDYLGCCDTNRNDPINFTLTKDK